MIIFLNRSCLQLFHSHQASLATMAGAHLRGCLNSYFNPLATTPPEADLRSWGKKEEPGDPPRPRSASGGLHRDAVGPQGRIVCAQYTLNPSAGGLLRNLLCVHPPFRMGEDIVSASSMGKCRGAKPLCRKFEGVPRIFEIPLNPPLPKGDSGGLGASGLKDDSLNVQRFAVRSAPAEPI